MNHIFNSLETQEKNQMQILRVYLYMGTNSLLKIWSQLEKSNDNFDDDVTDGVHEWWIKEKPSKTQNVPHTSLSQQLRIWMRMYWLFNEFRVPRIGAF